MGITRRHALMVPDHDKPYNNFAQLVAFCMSSVSGRYFDVYCRRCVMTGGTNFEESSYKLVLADWSTYVDLVIQPLLEDTWWCKIHEAAFCLAGASRSNVRFAAITEVVWFAVRKATWHHLLLVAFISHPALTLSFQRASRFFSNPKHVSSSPLVCQTLPLPMFDCSVVSVVFVWKKWFTNSMNLGCPGTFCRAKDLDILQ